MYTDQTNGTKSSTNKTGIYAWHSQAHTSNTQLMSEGKEYYQITQDLLVNITHWLTINHYGLCTDYNSSLYLRITDFNRNNLLRSKHTAGGSRGSVSSHKSRLPVEHLIIHIN